MEKLGILYRSWAIHLLLTITMVSLTLYAMLNIKATLSVCSEPVCLQSDMSWTVSCMVMSANLHDVFVYTACPVHTQLAFYKHKEKIQARGPALIGVFPAKLEERGCRGVWKYCDGSGKGNGGPPCQFNFLSSPSLQSIQMRRFNVYNLPYSSLSVKSQREKN
jgi:hypothetical protein